MIQIKRAYETPSKSDGYRVLVDRIWPRGIKKDDLPIDEWMKELAPSAELRKEFGHDPGHWKRFESRYKKELRTPEAKEKLQHLAELAQKEDVTLIYGARDKDHNQAVVLKSLIEKELLH